MYTFVFFATVLIISVWLAIEHNSRLKKQVKSHDKIIELKEKGHYAEICPKCDGRGAVRYFYWWSPHEVDCHRCGGLGYLYEIKEKQNKN